METPNNQYPNQVPNQYPGPAAQPAVRYHRPDSHYVMGLGVVLMCFGAAITGRHEVTMIGLAMIVFSSWMD